MIPILVDFPSINPWNHTVYFHKNVIYDTVRGTSWVCCIVYFILISFQSSPALSSSLKRWEFSPSTNVCLCCQTSRLISFLYYPIPIQRWHHWSEIFLPDTLLLYQCDRVLLFIPFWSYFSQVQHHQQLHHTKAGRNTHHNSNWFGCYGCRTRVWIGKSVKVWYAKQFILEQISRWQFTKWI